MTKRRILVTSALPYANGDLHLGYMLEVIQTDIWVRFQNMQGNECYYVCADDTHGTPIMLKAAEMGISPEELIASVSERHQADLSDFHINFSPLYFVVVFMFVSEGGSASRASPRSPCSAPAFIVGKKNRKQVWKNEWKKERKR